jgi:bla regulator protein BlaR1
VDVSGFFSAFVVKFLVLSVKASVTIGLIFALRLFFAAKKKSRFNHILWLALLLQLALPVELDMGWSPYRFIRADGRMLSALIPMSQPRTGAQTISEAEGKFSSGRAVAADSIGDGGRKETAAPNYALFAFAFLFTLWLSGAVLSGLKTVRTHRKFTRLASKAGLIHHQGITAVFEKSKTRMKLKSRIRLRQSSEVATPCVHGIVRCTVILPEGLLERFDEKEIECVLLHELSHIKRKDLWLDALVTLLGIAYWFHPAVTAAFRALRRDREYACDASALAVLDGEGARRYGRTLLHALERFATSPSPQCALGKMDTQSHLRRRITMIASFDRKPSRRYQMGAALFAAVVLVFGSMAAVAQEGGDNATGRSILFLGSDSRDGKAVFP